MIQTITDLSYLRSISCDDQEFVYEMVHTFLKETPASIEIIEKALSERNLTIAGKQAHKMKPSLVMMGIDALKPLLKEFEEFCENGEETEADALLVEIKKISQSAMEELVKIW